MSDKVLKNNYLKSNKTNVFNYYNKNINNNKYNNKEKDFILYTKDNKAYYLSSYVITNEFSLLHKASKNNNNFKLNNKVDNKVLEQVIEYMYKGKINNLNKEEVLSLYSLSYQLGNKNLENLTSQFLYENSNIEESLHNKKSYNNNNMIFNNYLIMFSLMCIFGMFFYYSNILKQIKQNNEFISNDILRLKEIKTKAEEYSQRVLKYNNKVIENRNKKELLVNYQTDKDDNINNKRDFTEFNNELITNLKNKIDYIDKEYNKFFIENSSVLLNKSKKDFKITINNKIEEYNKQFLIEIEELLNKKSLSSTKKLYPKYLSLDIDKMNISFAYINEDLYNTFKNNINKIKEFIETKLHENKIYIKNNKIIERSNELTKQTNRIKSFIDNVKNEINVKTNNILKQEKSLVYKDSLIKSFKKIISVKSIIDSTIHDNLKSKFDLNTYYSLLSSYAFNNKNFNFNLLFDYNRSCSNSDSFKKCFDTVTRNILNKNNLLFIVMKDNNNILGGYFKNSFPKFEELNNSLNNSQMNLIRNNDANSLIFNFSLLNNSYKVYNTKEYAKYQTSVCLNQLNKEQRVFKVAFGDCKYDSGLVFVIKEAPADVYFVDNSIVEDLSKIKVKSGIQSRSYFGFSNDDKDFISNNDITKDISYINIRIYEIDFIE